MSDVLLKNTFQKISSAYELIVDTTISVATTQVDFSGLNFGKDDDLLLVSDIVTGSATGSNYYLYLNGNTTDTNYYHQRITATSTTVSGARNNYPNMAYTETSGGRNLGITNIKLTNGGYCISQTKNTRLYGGSGVIIYETHTSSTFTATSITELNIKASAASGIGIGSRFQLYRLKAKKVADVIVGSATTQVDITGLSIDKDSEYMLVMDGVMPVGSAARLSVFPNDNVTTTNYYTQIVSADNTTMTALRSNINEPFIVAANNKGLAIASIKLTNNGYFAMNTSHTRNIGTSTLNMYNTVLSSTFTATSITKLSIVSTVASGIQAGSRFTLYRMDSGIPTPPTSIVRIGNMYTLTSNVLPSPYVASLLTSATGSAYQVFDNASGTSIAASNFAALTLGLGAQILFGKSIKIRKLLVRGLRSGQTNWTCSVYGIKEDNTDVLIHQATVAVSTDVIISSSDTTTLFKGFKVYIDTRSDLICNLYTAQVYEWIE